MKARLKFAVVQVIALVFVGYAVGFLSYKSPYGALSAVKGWFDRDTGHDSGFDSEILATLDRPSGPAPEGAPPNIILIVLDTTRADHMSYTGYHRDTSPHIDRMARDGVVYSNAHSVAPWTLPSHMSMFTGLPPGQHGATWQAFNEPEEMTMEEVLARKFTLDDTSRMLTVQLNDLGYSTAGFSTNMWVSGRTGFTVGFDAFHDVRRESRGLKEVYEGLPGEIRTSWSVDQGDSGLVLISFKQHVLENGGDLDQPFFLFFNLIDPHYPYHPPDAWRYAFATDRGLEKQKIDETALIAGDRPFDVSLLTPFYDAEVSYLDFMVGRLLNWLRKKGYYDDTLIVITSDHGEHLGEKGLFSHQLSMEEELLHVPLIIKYPGNEQAGSIVDHPLVSNIDVYETILAAARQGGDRKHRTISRDLRDMDSFDRIYLISEYYYSTPYLRQHQKLVPSFPVDENRIIRRVVFDSTGRHAFVEPGDLAADGDSARARAAQALSDYLLTVRSDVLLATDEPIDEETLERLRAFGYVN